MSISHSLALTRSSTNAGKLASHPISLVDTENPTSEDEPEILLSPNVDDSESECITKDVTRKSTRTTLKEELVRRKYSKYQKKRYSGSTTPQRNLDGGSDDTIAGPSTSIPELSVPKTQPVEPRDRPTSIQDDECLERAKSKTQQDSSQSKDTYEFDILYENQRGIFFFGIPNYSHKSLLNFDPAPWLTKDFKESSVDITNAQVPDLSWDWAWKRWYVDMSGDVDDEGWEYSFMFTPVFTWHGTHPWFHSFVRRRRWLRKRIKTQPINTKGKAGNFKEAHRLTKDYFTIHTGKRRPLSTNATSDSRGSFLADDEGDEPQNIEDISTLMKSLKEFAVDRQKIDAVKNFIEHGGEDLYYLAEKIPEIMNTFVFQNARRHLLTELFDIMQEARDHRNHHIQTEREENETEKRRIDNLLNAVKAAEEQVRKLEFWSDVEKVETEKVDMMDA
ncbi:MAG: hypothetical protein M1834_008685 [Cirrosporium novae-zelandiae]|nr:MAG: hypothetical protein M1834_008685 [Cirrosporium novae-zelandiae]